MRKTLAVTALVVAFPFLAACTENADTNASADAEDGGNRRFVAVQLPEARTGCGSSPRSRTSVRASTGR